MRRIIALLIAALMCASACLAEQVDTSHVADAGDRIAAEDVLEPGMQPVAAEALADGTYDVAVDSSSSMFKIASATVTKEGDALTAAFSGALLKMFPESSFVEIFCPDWKNNTLLISHMGEMNYLLADGKPVMKEAKTNYTPSSMPVVGYARFKAGPAVYMNVCRDEKGFKLVATEVEMLDAKNDAFTGSMRGWFKPACGCIAKFLEEHSRHGATHHSLLSYGMSLQQAAFFGRVLGLRVEII